MVGGRGGRRPWHVPGVTAGRPSPARWKQRAAPGTLYPPLRPPLSLSAAVADAAAHGLPHEEDLFLARCTLQTATAGPSSQVRAAGCSSALGPGRLRGVHASVGRSPCRAGTGLRGGYPALPGEALARWLLPGGIMRQRASKLAQEHCVHPAVAPGPCRRRSSWMLRGGCWRRTSSSRGRCPTPRSRTLWRSTWRWVGAWVQCPDSSDQLAAECSTSLVVSGFSTARLPGLEGANMHPFLEKLLC